MPTIMNRCQINKLRSSLLLLCVVMTTVYLILSSSDVDTDVVDVDNNSGPGRIPPPPPPPDTGDHRTASGNYQDVYAGSSYEYQSTDHPKPPPGSNRDTHTHDTSGHMYHSQYPSDDPRSVSFTGMLNVPERNELAFDATGFLFDTKGKSDYIQVEMVSSLVHSFSPYVEREAAKRFVDPPHSNTFVANSPAVMWYRGELVLVSRIWLVREKYEPKNDWPANHFGDNYFYTQRFDRSLKPVCNGTIMGIPTPKQFWVGDGPIEPRLCKVKDRLFVTFNAAVALGRKQLVDTTMMWDYVQNLPIIPEIKGGSPMLNASDYKKGDVVRDKHWMALIQDGELYFVHNLDPLYIMHCSLGGHCEFIHVEKDETGFVFQHHISHLRGGTPFELYEYPYYISVAHSTIYKESNHHRYYSAHIVVLCVAPYRVVYVGDALRIHADIYKEAPMVRPRWIDDGFIFPVGLLLETVDSMVIGVHVNDFSSVLLRFRGLKKLMASVIEKDKRNRGWTEKGFPNPKATRQGPPISYLHSHIHDRQENITGIEFSH